MPALRRSAENWPIQTLRDSCDHVAPGPAQPALRRELRPLSDPPTDTAHPHQPPSGLEPDLHVLEGPGQTSVRGGHVWAPQGIRQDGKGIQAVTPQGVGAGAAKGGRGIIEEQRQHTTRSAWVRGHGQWRRGHVESSGTLMSR